MPQKFNRASDLNKEKLTRKELETVSVKIRIDKHTPDITAEQKHSNLRLILICG